MSASRTVAVRRAFRRIMLAVDGPGNSGSAIELALTVAASTGADLVVTHVELGYVPIVPPFAGGVPLPLPTEISELEAEEEKRMSRWLRRLVTIAERRGVTARKVLIRSQVSVAEELANLATDEGADLIVVGTNHRGPAERFLFGSTSGELLKQAHCPVIVVP
jgi:nucleotide-binding universal stress UspA family protein